MNKPLKFLHLFTYSFYKQSEVFNLFKFSLRKVILYFVLLNLVMLAPLTYSVLSMDSIDYSYYGFDFHEDIPAWLPNDLPQGCQITDQRLFCPSDEVYTYTIANRGNEYTVYLNVSDFSDFKEARSIVYKETSIHINITEELNMVVSYSGYENVYFNDLKALPQEEAANILFDGLYRSVHPYLILPMIFLIIGGLMLTNFVFIALIAALAMLFKLTLSNFPCYKDMLKLFIIASTIPAMINLGLGFFGLGPFTSLIYNFLTPAIVFMIYSKNRRPNNEGNES